VTKLERVRRAAVRDYLTFFSKHHKYFIEGIASKDGSSVLVKPIEVADSLIGNLPEDGALKGLPVRHIDV
jgi:hypothetical protein